MAAPASVSKECKEVCDSALQVAWQNAESVQMKAADAYSSLRRWSAAGWILFGVAAVGRWRSW